MSNYTDQQITDARVFYRNYLDANNFTLGEHSSVLALVGYLEAQGSPKAEPVAVEDTEEYKAALKQRNHNWNELQKASGRIKELENEVVALRGEANTKEPEVKK